jgi:hypothetical protein
VRRHWLADREVISAPTLEAVQVFAPRERSAAARRVDSPDEWIHH